MNLSTHRSSTLRQVELQFLVVGACFAEPHHLEFSPFQVGQTSESVFSGFLTHEAHFSVVQPR